MDKMEAVLKNSIAVISDDMDLIEACKQGSRRAFDSLMKKYQNRVFSIALRMLKNEEEAKDVSQDVFFSVFKSIARFRGDSKFTTWLYRIVVNNCINKIKSKKRKQTEDIENTREMDVEESSRKQESTSSHIEGPERVLERKKLGCLIEQELSKLGSEARMIVLLRDVEGLPYEEIEKILSVPAGTVKSRLHRARMDLKKRLSKLL